MAGVSIGLSTRNLYAELTQRALFDSENPTPGTVATKRVKGREYLSAKEKHGQRIVERYLGAADDPEVQRIAAAIRDSRNSSNERRRLIQMIKRAGVAGPTLETGRVLEALERSGLFESGLILVGTQAFQIYPIIIGEQLSTEGMMTNDADFAVASIVSINGDADLSTVLKRADPSFAPQIQLRKTALPKRFRAANGYVVEILTPVRSRKDEDPVAIKSIGASATPLHYLEFLIEEAMTAVALYGSGVRVKIPQPERYAVHKLIIAAQPERDRAKRRKDLLQAKELIEAIGRDNPTALANALIDAASRGPKWKAAMRDSLAFLEPDGIAAHLPIGFMDKLSARRPRPRVEAGKSGRAAKPARSRSART
ncbi:MAG: GSU2403 family nucleotidyltransferase fold protein [Beijerinckiaceae bacterium]